MPEILQGDFSLFLNLQTISEIHQASYSEVTREFFSRVNRPEREANHSPPSSPHVVNEWCYNSAPLFCFQGAVSDIACIQTHRG